MEINTCSSCNDIFTPDDSSYKQSMCKHCKSAYPGRLKSFQNTVVATKEALERGVTIDYIGPVRE